MSSAQNHAKRSRRSEHDKHAALGAYARRAYVRQAYKPKKTNPFQMILRKIRRAKEATN